MKTKKCKHCKVSFEQQRPLQYICSPSCAHAYSLILRSKKERKEKLEAIKSLLTHKDYLKMLQVVFNSFIRKRDKDLPCVSCGTYKAEEFHAGHYIASTFQYLRFNENNVWKQCSRCNTHLRGNSIPYRIELIKRIGLKEVEKLESERMLSFKLTIPELKDKIKYYKNKIKNT